MEDNPLESVDDWRGLGQIFLALLNLKDSALPDSLTLLTTYSFYNVNIDNLIPCTHYINRCNLQCKGIVISMDISISYEEASKITVFSELEEWTNKPCRVINEVLQLSNQT